MQGAQPRRVCARRAAFSVPGFAQSFVCSAQCNSRAREQVLISALLRGLVVTMWRKRDSLLGLRLNRTRNTPPWVSKLAPSRRLVRRTAASGRPSEPYQCSARNPSIFVHVALRPRRSPLPGASSKACSAFLARASKVLVSTLSRGSAPPMAEIQLHAHIASARNPLRALDVQKTRPVLPPSQTLSGLWEAVGPVSASRALAPSCNRPFASGAAAGGAYASPQREKRLHPRAPKKGIIRAKEKVLGDRDFLTWLRIQLPSDF